MKFTKIMMLVLISALLFGSIQTAFAIPPDNRPPDRPPRNQQDVDIDVSNTNLNLNTASSGSSATNKSNNIAVVDVDTIIDDSTLIPAPLIPVPGFLSPDNRGGIDDIWTKSPFNNHTLAEVSCVDANLPRPIKVTYRIPELCRVANPSRALGFLYYEWTKSFQIEIACYDKAEPQSQISVYPADCSVLGSLKKMGEGHARAIELHKSERQVAAALAVYAAKQGAKVIVLKTFSNPVTRGDSAVIGGGGARAIDPGNIVNGIGGFGWTTSERVYRAFAVAELYR